MTSLEEEDVLTPPEEFRFPFPPYEIQTQFMTSIFRCLEAGQLGIFESPTGTGGSVAELERRERGYRTAATSLSLLRQGLEVQYQGPAGHHRSQTLRQQTFILINIEGSPG